MNAIRRVAYAALLAVGFGAISCAVAMAQTPEFSAEIAQETQEVVVTGTPAQDQQQLALDRQQVAQAVQQMRQDLAAGDQASAALDQQAALNARLVLITEQLAVDRDLEAQSPPLSANLQALLTIRDRYLTAEQMVVAVRLRLAVDRQANNGGATQADQMILRQTLAQAALPRQQWIAIRARFPAAQVTASTSATVPSPTAAPALGQRLPNLQSIQPPPPPQGPQPTLAPAPTTH